MSLYVVGGVVRLKTTVTDSTGTLADPSSITVSVQKPDLTIDGPYTPTHDSTGTYHYDYTPATAGHYVARWVSSGTNAGVGEEEFDVRASYAAGIVSLADLKTFLFGPSYTATTNDGLLGDLIEACTATCEYWFGPIVPRTVTEVYDGGWYLIGLRQPPVVSITSVTEYLGSTPYPLTSQPEGSTVNNYGYDLVDPDNGLLVRRSGAGTPMPFQGGQKAVVVTYIAGRQSIPADIRFAALEDMRGIWQQTQQGGRPSFNGGPEESDWTVGPLHQFPRLAAIAAGPTKLPGIA